MLKDSHCSRIVLHNVSKRLPAYSFLILAWCGLLSHTQAQPVLPAFPGAEGFGAESAGGRGGRVIEVTTLADSGPGSLRSALESSGPRTIVFRVGGTIQLDSSIEIHNPYVTIAGQTAPGGGITLKNSPLNPKTPLKIETHNVIVRYIRSRPGSNPNETGTLDALTISSKSDEVYNVIVDHSSFSWATDEVVNLYYAARDITVQWSIIAEGLDCSTHIEDGERQCHSMGMLLGHDGSRNYSIHHNLFAHNRRRNPRIKTTGTVDVVNNVVYNPGFGENSRSPTYVHGELGIVPANYVANYFKPGPSTSTADWFIDTKEIVAVYIEGNSVPHHVVNPDPEDLANVVSVRHSAPAVTTTTADVAYQQVLAGAGADIGLNCDGTVFPRRDVADQRIIGEVRTGTGRIIDEPDQVGGWPALAAGLACADADHDGMPDEWETVQGLDPNDPADGNRLAPTGYTWLETFLNPPFLAEASLQVLAVNPEKGRLEGETEVRISGTGFVQGAKVFVDGNPATNVIVAGTTFISALTPAGSAGLADVTVTNPDQSSETLINGFTYEDVGVADLSITKIDESDPVERYGSIAYTVTVTNLGPDDAGGVVVTDTFPEGVVFLSTTGCAEDPAGVPDCLLGDIPAGASASYVIAGSIQGGSPDIVTNSVTVNSNNTQDPNLANNSAFEHTAVSSGGGVVTTVEVRVAARADDAEEDSSGEVDLKSSDLEMTHDRGAQTVGMRFTSLPIPFGATVVKAYVQFQVDEKTSLASSLLIEAEDADFALPFAETPRNISQRQRTSRQIPWVPASWPAVGEAGPDQRTPDLSALIQQVVNRSGWTAGNALVLIVTGTGERVAESFDGVSAAAPLLHVEFMH